MTARIDEQYLFLCSTISLVLVGASPSATQGIGRYLVCNAKDLASSVCPVSYAPQSWKKLWIKSPFICSHYRKNTNVHNPHMRYNFSKKRK